MNSYQIYAISPEGIFEDRYTSLTLLFERVTASKLYIYRSPPFYEEYVVLPVRTLLTVFKSKRSDIEGWVEYDFMYITPPF